MKKIEAGEGLKEELEAIAREVEPCIEVKIYDAVYAMQEGGNVANNDPAFYEYGLLVWQSLRVCGMGPERQAVIMAHEVGHLKTFDNALIGAVAKSYESAYHSEVLASRWALAFLRPRVSAEQYEQARRFYSECLAGYYQQCNNVKREVLK